MALFDKVKAQATQVAQKAQEAAQGASRAGQARIGDMQARHKLDGLYRELGAAVYAQHAGRADATTASEIERLYGELERFEAEHDAGTMSAPPDSDPAPGSGSGTTSEGDFKL